MIAEKTSVKTESKVYMPCYGCGKRVFMKWFDKRYYSFLCNGCLKIWEGGKFYPREIGKES